MSIFETIEASTEASTEEQKSGASFDDFLESPTLELEASEIEGIEEKSNEHISAANSDTGNDIKGRNEETGKVEEEVVADVKMLKASLSDKEYDIPATAELTAMINGEEIPVSVQELLNNYSGKVVYDKKFQELSTEKKQFLSEKESHTTVVNDFMTNMGEGKINEALMLLGKQAGKNPYEFMVELRNGFLEQNQLLNTLSPEQKEAYLAKEEAEYLRQENESIIRVRNEQENLRGLENSLVQLKETQGLEDAELSSAWDKLVNHAGSVEELITKYNGHQGAVNALGQFIAAEKAYERSYASIEDYKDLISPEEQGTVVETLVDTLLQNPNVTDEMISQWLDEAYSSRKSSKRISEKATKTKKVLPTPQKKQEVENFFDFDEL